MYSRNLTCLVLFFFGASNAYAWNPFAPTDNGQCIEKAANNAKSEYALRVLINQCNKEFPGKKDAYGNFYYYDVETQQNIQVSGSKLTESDINKIQIIRNKHRLKKAPFNRGG